MIIQLSQQSTASASGPERDTVLILDEIGKFILAHSEKPYLVAVLCVVGAFWIIWRLSSKRGIQLEAGLRLVVGILSIAGGLVTAAVLLLLQQPDCSRISSENQMLAGFIALLAGLAMGGKELKESFSSQESDRRGRNGKKPSPGTEREH